MIGWQTALQLGAIGLGDWSSMQASKMGAKAYEASAAQNRKEAGETRTITRYKIRLIRQAGAESLSTIEGETGKSGLAMSGTPLIGLVQSAREVELAAALTKRSGEITAERYEVAAYMDKQSAKAAEKAAKSKAGGLLGGIGGLVLAGPWGGLIGYVGGSLAGGM